MYTIRRGALLALMVLLAGSAPRATAQSQVTSGDIQQLQNAVYDVGGDISRLRTRDSNLAAQLQDELESIREDITYLKVKLRKEGTVSQSEYADVRDRLDSLRDRARVSYGENTGSSNTGSIRGGTTGGNYPANPDRDRPSNYPDRDQDRERANTVRRAARPNEVPEGTEIDVRLERSLSSATAQVEDRFKATTVVDLYNGDRVLIPAGSELRGIISSVNKAGRIERKGSLTVAFDQITIHGRAYPIHGVVTQALESEGIKGEAGRIGAGAGVGAIIGGILGGLKGALAGILIGGGGVIAATEGQDVNLAAGTVLRVKLDTPLVVNDRGR